MNRSFLIAILLLMAVCVTNASERTNKKKVKASEYQIEMSDTISHGQDSTLRIDIEHANLDSIIFDNQANEQLAKVQGDTIKSSDIKNTEFEERNEIRNRVDSITANTPNYKFGYIDTELLFTLMPEYKAAIDSIASFSKMYENEYIQMQQELQDKMKVFQEKQVTMTDNMRMFKQQEIQTLSKLIDLFEQISQQDIQMITEKYQQPIEQHINELLTEIGKEEGFTAILRLRYYDSFTGQVKTNIPYGIDVLPIVMQKLKIQ